MSEVPRGWVEATIGDFLRFNYGKGLPERERSGSEFPVFGSNGIIGYHDHALVQTESLVVGRKGSVGEVHHAKGPCWPIDTTYYVDNFSRMPARFWYYALKSRDLGGLNRATAIPGLNREDAYQVKIALPPLNEQKRISDKLDAVLGRVNACSERLECVPIILKRFRQSILAAATSGKLTEEWRADNPTTADATQLAEAVQLTHESAGGHKAGNAAPPTEDVHDLSTGMFPPDWALLTLRDLVSPARPITYGILKPGPELEDGVPYVRVADFPNEKLNLSTIRRTSSEMDQEFKRSRLKRGDLLLSIRGTVGRLIVIPEELEGANITQDSARLSIQPVVNRDYVLWYLRSESAQSRMKGATKGVAVRGINIGDVRAIQVPLPSRDEQDEIVRRVESLFAYAERLEARYIAARDQVERLAPALLAKAFRGELVPQDPNDEPASVLLDRVKAARKAAVSPPPQRKMSAMRKQKSGLVDLIRAKFGHASFSSRDLPILEGFEEAELREQLFECLDAGEISMASGKDGGYLLRLNKALR